MTQTPREELRETRFEWIKGLQKDWQKGVLADKVVKPMKRVGTFVWEADSTSDSEDEADMSKVGVYFHGGGESDGIQFPLAGTSGARLLHAGLTRLRSAGYTHFSAHEVAQTSIIPRRMMKVKQQAGSLASTS